MEWAFGIRFSAFGNGMQGAGYLMLDTRYRIPDTEYWKLVSAAATGYQYLITNND